MTSSPSPAAPEATPETAIDRPATESGFASLGLTGAILKAVAETGYTTPTPIQAQAIPPLLKGRDLLGLAETGTGKTAAFALPLIQRLVAENRDRTPRKCRALILAPTRELAIQIAESLDAYGKHTTLTHTLIYGGVGSNPQMRAMQKGVDIIVATPGRLLDLIASRYVHLDEVTHFVLDEADRMLDMGFIHDVRRVVKLLPKSRQSLLFSATMPDDIARLAAEMLNKPERIEVARAGKTVDRIEQSVHFVGAKEKRAALAALLQNAELKRVIVFTRTKRGANRVADTLDVAGIASVAIHGNKSQNARQAALDAFRKGEARVLVATDIAARGIDIDEITHVINYELPNVPESYVHRIGRTARAGADGNAIALCAPDERPYLRDIERLTKTPLKDAGTVPGIEKFMSLPEPKRKRRDDDDEAPHFARGKARIESGRGNNRVREDKPADARAPRGDDRRGGGFGRGDDRGPPRGPRKPFDGERRGPAAGGERREWKPREDRGPSAGGERREWKPREDRGPSAGGERREWKPREDRGPRPGAERRDWKPREDRPRSDAPAAVSAAAPGDAAVEKPKFNPMDVNARRPRDDVSREVRPREERPRFDDRRGGPPRGDRGPRPAGDRRDGERRDWKPREDRGDRGSQGARGGDDRRPFKPREDRGPRPEGGFRQGGDRPGGRPFEARGPRPGGARPGGARPGGPRTDGERTWKPREDRGPSLGGGRPGGDRPDGERRDWKSRGDRPSGDRPSGQRDGGKPWERRDGASRPPARRDGPPGSDGSQPRKRAKPDEA